MKQISKKVVAALMSLALVVSSIAVSGDMTMAKTGDIDVDVADADYNLALGKQTDIYPGCAEGSKDYINDGKLGTDHCALSNGWGYSGESYVIIDLGSDYESSSLDEIVIQYKDSDSGDTVVGHTYSIQYSEYGIEYETVVEEKSVESLDEYRLTRDDVSGIETDPVRYIKIDYPSTPVYGIQITEVAIFAENPIPATVETCDDPEGFVVNTDNYNAITVSVTPAEGQVEAGYVYDLFMDDASFPTLENMEADTEYTIENLQGGTHTITVKGVYNHMVSEGISRKVWVTSLSDEVTNIRKNIAFGKDFTLSSGTSTEGSGSLTDGIISHESYVTSTKARVGTYMTIDLGKEYDPKDIESVCVWYRTSTGGCYPSSNGQEIRFAGEDEEFVTAGSTSQDEFDSKRQATVDDDGVFYVNTETPDVEVDAVRYVRVYWASEMAYGAQVSEIAVFGSNDIELEPGEIVMDKSYGNDGETVEWEELGGYLIYVGSSWDENRVIAGVDTEDENHIMLQQLDGGIWADPWALQIKKEFTGLLSNETYTINWKMKASSTEGTYVYSGDNDTEHKIYATTQTITSTFKTDSYGNAEFALGLGYVGISNVIELFEPEIAVYVPETEAPTTEAPTETPTEAPAEETTTEPIQETTEPVYDGAEEVTTEAATETMTDATTISSVTAPGKATIKKIKKKKMSAKKVTVKVKKIADANGYEVSVYKTKKKAKKNKKAIVTADSQKRKVIVKSKKLKNKAKLFVRARAYKEDEYGIRVYGEWSKVKKVKIKK